MQAFLSIAERGSFQRAAAHLNLSQTALSHRIRKFEGDLGVKLLQRTTRHVSLSPAGLALLPKARRIIDDIDASFDELRQFGSARQERIAIGCLPTIANRYLPRLLGAFSADYPDLIVKIYDNSASEIAGLVQSGTVEFGITILSASRPELEVKPLLKEPFVLVCPRAHAFAKQKSVDFAALAGVPLVRISPQAGNRALIDDALGSRRESLNWRYEVQHVATAISMAEAGVGLTIVPRLSMHRSPNPGVVAVPLRNPGIVRTLGIMVRRGVPLSPPAEALASMLKKQLRTER
ncbi:MAG: LysR family transcriptional regulator [Rhodospirillales bacterium]|nr:LysR family transcriptional regulator [Rhodospirillales bacterium]